MHNRKILIIGEVYVDQHLDIIENGYSTSRLGGIFHAARSCDALNIEYALAYYAPDYLVKDVEKFGIDVLRASSIFRLGKVDKAPNVMLIGQSDESGNQLYENILGRQAEYVSMLPFMQVLDDFDPTDIIIFPGRYGNAGILSNLSNYEGKIHIDMNYDCDDILDLDTIKIQTVFLSTSSTSFEEPKQLSKALFEDLGLPAKKKTKSGYSTNAEVLESLRDAHPAVAMLLDYRTLSKLKSTYCDGLLKVIDTDGRIHSSFNQTETRTGRISSTEPNLQNIPVRQELGREMRRFFTTRDGWLLCDADYSQIELRVLAHMAQDPTMIETFNTDADIHTITASQVFQVPPEMVTPLMRSRAKAVNFGIVYGIGAHSLSEDIGVSYGEAKRYIEDYLRHYSAVDGFMNRLIEDAKQKGYGETLFHRRRPLPELKASQAMTRHFGERVARNMPIQGTAADIIKIAMVRVHRRLRQEQMQARLILQVHDELIVEAPAAEADKVTLILQQEMEAAADLSVKLAVDAHTGATWYDAKG